MIMADLAQLHVGKSKFVEFKCNIAAMSNKNIFAR